ARVGTRASESKGGGASSPTNVKSSVTSMPAMSGSITMHTQMTANGREAPCSAFPTSVLTRGADSCGKGIGVGQGIGYKDSKGSIPGQKTTRKLCRRAESSRASVIPKRSEESLAVGDPSLRSG